MQARRALAAQPFCDILHMFADIAVNCAKMAGSEGKMGASSCAKMVFDQNVPGVIKNKLSTWEPLHWDLKKWEQTLTTKRNKITYQNKN